MAFAALPGAMVCRAAIVAATLLSPMAIPWALPGLTAVTTCCSYRRCVAMALGRTPAPLSCGMAQTREWIHTLISRWNSLP
jgi:hypothetical protein